MFQTILLLDSELLQINIYLIGMEDKNADYEKQIFIIVRIKFKNNIIGCLHSIKALAMNYANTLEIINT